MLEVVLIQSCKPYQRSQPIRGSSGPRNVLYTMTNGDFETTKLPLRPPALNINLFRANNCMKRRDECSTLVRNVLDNPRGIIIISM